MVLFFLMNPDEVPLLTEEEITNRQIVLLAKIEIDQLLLQREKIEDGNETAIVDPDIFVLPYNIDDFRTLEEAFNFQSEQLKAIAFERYILQSELIFASVNCQFERLKTQRLRYTHYNRMDRKIAQKKNRKPSLLYSKAEFEAVDDEINQLKKQLEF